MAKSVVIKNNNFSFVSKIILTTIITVFSLLSLSLFSTPILVTASSCITGQTIEGKTLSSEFKGEWNDCFGLDQAAGVNKDIKDLQVQKKSSLEIVANILGLALSFLGVIFFLVIIGAGLVWMTASGNSEKAEKAKDMLEAAVIGLIIILGAYAITKFVFKNFGAEQAPQFSDQSSSNKSCLRSNVGVDCGGKYQDGTKIINMRCNNKHQCVTRCELKWPKTGKCQDLSKGRCPKGKTKADNYCPSPSGNSNFKCCHGNV